jgi:hypothetical protein
MMPAMQPGTALDRQVQSHCCMEECMFKVYDLCALSCIALSASVWYCMQFGTHQH